MCLVLRWVRSMQAGICSFSLGWLPRFREGWEKLNDVLDDIT